MEKERRTKALLLSTLVVVVATLSIAFASLSRTLSINGIGKMDTASWSVYFNKLEGPNVVRGAKQVSAPSISTDKGTVQDINVKLSNPKDEISYTVDIVNDGTIDAEITMIKDIELTDVQKKVFEFKVTYTSTGEVLKDGDVLPAGDTKNITINIKFKDDITEFDLPSESQTINLSYQITYTQYDGGNLPIGPDGGVTTEKAILAKGLTLDELYSSDDFTLEPFFNSELGRGQVKSINFVNDKNVPEEASSTVWDASEAKDSSILGWYQPSDEEGLFDVYIGSNANVYAPSDSSALFALFISLKEINFNNFYTSDVVNMSSMFNGCFSLTSLDVTSFNTSNVINMSKMFSESAIEIINLSSFDTSKVTDMSSMFECTALTSLDLSSFDTSNVTTMDSMFEYCKSLAILNVSSFDTKKVTTMQDMFFYCSSLVTLDLSSFATPALENISNMFDEAKVSTLTVDLTNADFSIVTKYNGIFSGTSGNFIIIVNESQKELATNIFKTSQYDDNPNLLPDTIITVVTPSEL